MKVREILVENNEVHDMMLKVRKNSYGFLTPSKLAKIFNQLPGWSIEKKVLVIPTNVINADEQKALGIYTTNLLANNYNKDFVSIETLAHNGKEFEDDDIKLIESARDKILANSKIDVPKKPKNETYYFSDVSQLKTTTGPGWKSYGFTFKANYASNGFVITSPDKKVLEISKEPNYIGINTGKLVNWLRTETTFHDDVLKALGMEAYEVSKAKERTRENTGTCPCCFDEYKLNNGKMVHHGYNRPGHGYIVGDCFGVGYKPFEKSNEGTKQYVTYLSDIIEKRKNKLRDLESGKIKTLMIKIKGKLESIDQTHNKWNSALENEIYSTRSYIKYIKEDITTLTDKIDNWKEEELPWEKLNKDK